MQEREIRETRIITEKYELQIQEIRSEHQAELTKYKIDMEEMRARFEIEIEELTI